MRFGDFLPTNRWQDNIGKMLTDQLSSDIVRNCTYYSEHYHPFDNI